jgi:hypothetical protein
MAFRPQSGLVPGTIDGQLIIDDTNTEAFLVRKDGDTGDVFTVDTSASNILANARLKMGTSQPFWPSPGKAAGLQFLGTAATRAGIIYDTDEGMSLVAGDNDGNGNHVVALISGGNVLKDHDMDTFQTDPTFFYFSNTDPDSDNTQYGTARHDTFDFVLGAGSGEVKIERGQKWNRTTSAAGNYTAVAGDMIIAKTGITASGDTVTLMAASGMEGRVLIIKDESGNAGTDNITIDGNAAETIDGTATIPISVDYGVIRLYSDGSNWFTI